MQQIENGFIKINDNTDDIAREALSDNTEELNNYEKNYAGVLKFTNQEILKMPKFFRNYFKTNGHEVHYRKRTRGKNLNSFTYEARYRKDGYNICINATTKHELVERFIEKLHDTAPTTQNVAPQVPKTFDAFATYWFENFHKRKVKENTYNHNVWLYNHQIKERFGKLNIASIVPNALQTFLDEFKDKGKTADDIHSILNQIFNCALNHGIIKLNPLKMVFHQSHEREHGKAISKADEQRLLQAFKGQPYQLYFAIILYTGLRPNEYPTARIEGKFVKAVNSKHGKNGKVIYKRIPISPMLRQYLDGTEQIDLPKAHILQNRFKKILPEHKLYDMRTTFQTRCTECGISDVVIGIIMGNSIGKLKEAYTDLSDDYLLKEINKLNY